MCQPRNCNENRYEIKHVVLSQNSYDACPVVTTVAQEHETLLLMASDDRRKQGLPYIGV